MKALVFGAPPAEDEVRPTPADELEAMLAGIPFGLRDIDDARLVRPDWVLTRPILSGICGSDAKLVLGDFNTGDIDNPMAAFSSLPHVPGHEVVAEVVSLGPEAHGLDVGQRVVLNPWLTCGPRGIDPLCPPCQAGDLSLCWSFTKGDLGPGVHVGVITGAPGAWAEQLAAHDSMLIPVPDGISDEAAVLADPFSVSFHAIVRHPPPPTGQRARLRGRRARPDQRGHPPGPLPRGGGRCRSARFVRSARDGPAVRCIRRLRPRAAPGARRGTGGVVRRRPPPPAGRLARDASRPHRRRLRLHRQGGDARGRGRACWPSAGGWSTPAWPPPSDGSPLPSTSRRSPSRDRTTFGMEDFEGHRRHAITHYLQFVDEGRLDITPILTHRFGLEEWWPALKALARQDRSGALKVAFTPNG